MSDDSKVTPSGGGPVGGGCGVVLGLVVGVTALASSGLFEGIGVSALVVGLCGAVFGFFGWRSGDRFFRWILPQLAGWWP